MNHLILLLVILQTFIISNDAYKVLVFNPAFGASHSNFLGKISDILIDAGHDVTMLIPISIQGKKHLVGSKKVRKIIKIEQDPRSVEMHKQTGSEDILRKQIWSAESDIKIFLNVIGNFSLACGYQCENIFKQTAILNNLRDENFDLGITESLFICAFPLFDHIGVNTVINADSTLFMDAMKYALGEPASPSFYPGLISPLTDKMSLVGRVKNAIGMQLSMYFSKMRFEKELEMIRPYYNNSEKGWKEHLEGVSFNFINSNRYLDYASPTLPKTVFVGGMQVDTNRKTIKLDKKWDEVLSTRKQNVLVSFGSNAYSSDMPDEFKSSFLKLFESMPDTTFIWKYEVENSTIAAHLPNVKLAPWMPQNDILADDRLSLFITHGGLGSTMELAYQGKPAVIIPLMADQPRNAHMLARHGGAIQVEKTDLSNPRKIFDAVALILKNKEYRRNAEKLAVILAEQPYSPKEVVLKHCDFAVKHGPLEVLNSEGRNLNFAVFYSLDIVSVLCIIFVVLVAVIYFVVKTGFQLLKKCSGVTKLKSE